MGLAVTNNQQNIPGHDNTSNGDEVKENLFVSICDCER